MALLALLIAVPIGVSSAIYLVEYAKPGSRFVRVVRVTTETLQGIPSIIYGLFGMLFFTTVLGWGLSLLSGACTLAIMVLPVVMRTAEEALIAVPASYRAGGFALGAGYLRTIFRCVLAPSALPGIVGGVLLALGRCVGEVAALLFTAGTIAQIPDFGGQGIFALFDSCRTLAVHMYVLASEGLHIDETYATAVVLLVLVMLLNVIVNVAEKRLLREVMAKGRNGCLCCCCFAGSYEREKRMNLSIDRASSEQRSEFACENAFQQPLGDRERAPERYEVDEQVKMEVRDLDLHYGDFHALKNVSLSFPKNQVTALIGPSGCGKSTLLKTLNRMNDLVEGCRSMDCGA